MSLLEPERYRLAGEVGGEFTGDRRADSSSLWYRIWFPNEDLHVNLRPHSGRGHLYGVSPVCCRECEYIACSFLKTLLQPSYAHFTCFSPLTIISMYLAPLFESTITSLWFGSGSQLSGAGSLVGIGVNTSVVSILSSSSRRPVKPLLLSIATEISSSRKSSSQRLRNHLSLRLFQSRDPAASTQTSCSHNLPLERGCCSAVNASVQSSWPPAGILSYLQR
mmetsp:Transcript_6592/g.19968  ORF Transcript_6592/g.19968 Transcript_6592/m.19968 type:complete len:221 (+) Transcript_6592:301-963(+)